MSQRNRLELVDPQWPAPVVVNAFTTTRSGGVSEQGYASLNLGLSAGDHVDCVEENRRRLEALIPTSAGWLRQVHGNSVHYRGSTDPALAEADAVWTDQPDLPCTLLTADCLPVLFCDHSGSVVAAVHAGWRGLAGGVLEATLDALPVASSGLMAWIGPGISVSAYEVGNQFEHEFRRHLPWLEGGFHRIGDRVHADLVAIAKAILIRHGVTQIFGGNFCTYTDQRRFFSHRRNPRSGRMATVIWLSRGEK